VSDQEKLMSLLISCRTNIELALQYTHGTHLFADVCEGVLSGTMQLWPGKKSCAVTEIIRYPRKKILHCFLAAGDMDEILLMQKDAKEWGQAQGCEEMTIAGREGWKRVLSKYGWKHGMTTMSIEL